MLHPTRGISTRMQEGKGREDQGRERHLGEGLDGAVPDWRLGIITRAIDTKMAPCTADFHDHGRKPACRGSSLRLVFVLYSRVAQATKNIAVLASRVTPPESSNKKKPRAPRRQHVGSDGDGDVTRGVPRERPLSCARQKYL